MTTSTTDRHRLLAGSELIRKLLDEGSAERQEDLRELQGHPTARHGAGHLHQSASQAASGLSRLQSDSSVQQFRTTQQDPETV